MSNEFFLSRSKIFSRFSVKLQPTSSHLKQLMLCANKNAKVAAELMEQLRPGSNAHNYHTLKIQHCCCERIAAKKKEVVVVSLLEMKN